MSASDQGSDKKFFSSEKQANKMAQKGLMRILSRKDGKSMVSDDKDSEKVKLTKVLESIGA